MQLYVFGIIETTGGKNSATQKTRIEPSDIEFSDKTRELKTKPAPDILQEYPDLSISIAPPI